MRYALYLPNFGPTGDVHTVTDLARRAEATGWDAVFVWDHFEAGALPVLDPWVALAAIATQTERVMLGPMIVPLARRRPQKVALEAATLAALAPGRFILGVGLGAPHDFELFGEDSDWRVRADKVDAGIATLRRAWAGKEVVPGIRFFDEPLPHIPVWVSGGWPRKQPFHGVEQADGVFPISQWSEENGWQPLSPQHVHECLVSVPERARGDFAIWGFDDRGTYSIDEYEAAGVTWWTVDMFQLPLEERYAVVEAGPKRYVVRSS
jgi:alkanesulfonate monooxygenase SsuD/methylene tetrahydromethanopterin reductase-like flavin-dependent oxidoreductase (luciferase family)